MTVAFGTIGAISDGTTSISTAYPASISAADLLLYFAASKYASSSHSTPSGFTFLDNDTGGIGSDIADSGSVVASVWRKDATGSESGNESVTVTSGNVAQGAIVRVTRSGGIGFIIDATTARWNTDNTNPVDVTFDDTVDFQAGDYVLVCAPRNTDLGSAGTAYSAASLTVAGVTFSSHTERAWTGTVTGGDMRLVIVDFTVSSGSGTAAPQFQATKAGTSQGEGPVILIRIREDAGAPRSDPPFRSQAARYAPLFHF
jgi:hypothetical protein